MRFKGIFMAAGFAGLLAAGAGLRASDASNAAAFDAALSDNLKAASAFLADPLNKSLAYSVGSQGFAPPTAKPLLGFNLGGGVGIAVTSLDKSGVESSAMNNGTDLTAFTEGLPDTLPVPLGLVDLHFGLPKLLFFESLDLGVKYRGLNFATGKNTIAMTGLGFEVRGNIFEAGLVSPVNLTLGLGVDTLKTEMRFREDPKSFSGTYDDGVNPASTITGTSAFLMDVDSQIVSTNLYATVSRKLIFVEPYLGLGLNVISGDTTVRGGQVSDMTFSGGGGGATLTKTIEGKATKPAPSMDARVAGGLVFHMYVVYLELGGEYGFVSGGAGGHAQFGFKFR